MSEPTTMPNELDAGADVRVEAAMKAIYEADQEIYDHSARETWEEYVATHEGDPDPIYEAEARAALAAADAVGAVGVTVDQLDAQTECEFAEAVAEYAQAAVNEERNRDPAQAKTCDHQRAAAHSKVMLLFRKAGLLTNQQPATSDGATGGEEQ